MRGSRRWRLAGSHDGVLLVRSGAGHFDPLGTPGGEALHREAAASQVDAWFPEGWGDSSSTLREIGAALGEDPFSSGGSPAGHLKRLVRQALRDGRLVAVRAHVPLPTPGGSEAAEPEEAPGRPVAPREEKTWIEIVLRDDDDPPKPVPFKKYRVELPDGSAREGMLDAYGKAMLVGIDPGTCQVSFPDFDEKDWGPA